MLKSKTVIAVLFLIILSACSSAQSRLDSLYLAVIPEDQFRLSTIMDKQLNTYNLNSSVFASQNYSNLFFTISENYNSTLIMTYPKNIKDEQYLQMITGYRIKKWIAPGIFVNGNILSDDRKLGLNQASNYSTSLFTRLMPLERIYIVPFAGYMSSRQIGQKDEGLAYGMEARVDRIRPGSETELNSSLKYYVEDLSPRKNFQELARISSQNRINEDSRNELTLYYSRQKKDFYFGSDSLTAREFSIVNNIQSRSESNYYIQDQFDYRFNDFQLGVTGRTIWKDVRRDTKYRLIRAGIKPDFNTRTEEFRLELESSTSYSSRNFEGILRFSYSERDENHFIDRISTSDVFMQDELERQYDERLENEKQKNNRSVRGMFMLSGNWRISGRDRLTFSVLHSKLRYDTPSGDNFDDRDELMSVFGLYYIRNLTPVFDLSLNLEADLDHTVYIFEERSSNNNYRRLLKFAAEGIYRGSRLVSRNKGEVSANYTVYDFEEINPNVRSFSFRQLSFADSSVLKVTDKLHFSLLSSMKFSEQGDFHWKSFSGRPTRDLREYQNEARFIFYTHNFASFSFGFRYLKLSTYTHLGKERIHESDYLTRGPVAAIEYPFNNRLLIRMTGAYEFIRYEKNKNRNLASMNLLVNWQL